jgi:hypothetical protein
MRLPWIFRRPSPRQTTRRKKAAPLRVRRLERRRVLDAAVTDVVFAPADLDASTAIHDTNEGTQFTATANATGTGQLFYEWTLKQGATTVAQSFSPMFSFTPPDQASYTLTVKVVDSTQSSATRTEEVLVHNLRPVLTVPPNQFVDEGSPLELTGMDTLPLGLFFDDGKTDSHTATVDWGDGSTPESVDVLEMVGTGSGAIVGSHTYDDGLHEYKVTVTVDDGDGGVDSQSFFVTVENVAPTADFDNSGPVLEGSPGTVSFSNPFDPSSADTTAGFRYAYDFDNDGTFDEGNGTYAGSTDASSQMVSPALLAEGPGVQTVRAWIIDKNDDHTEYFTDIDIVNDDPELINIVVVDDMINEGETATIVMNINDSGALDVFEVDVDWQDGPLDTIAGLGLMSFDGTAGNTDFQWDAQSRQLTVSHLYRDDNPTGSMSDSKTVSLVVRDDDLGESIAYHPVIVVSNLRPVLVVQTDLPLDGDTLVEGTELDLSGMNAPALALFRDDGVEDTHTVLVNWGDGTMIDDNLTFFSVDGATVVGGKHTYADDGKYKVTVTVMDDDGGKAEESFTVTVSNLRPTLAVTPSTTAIDEGQSVSFEATFDDAGSDNEANLDPFMPPAIGDPLHESFRYFVDWGDGRQQLPDQPVNDTDLGVGFGSTGMFDGTHIYADDGTYTVTVRIADDNMTGDFLNGTKDVDYVEQSFTVTVSNLRPTLAVTPSTTAIDEGQSVSFEATFDDAGSDNEANLDPFMPPAIGDPLHESFRYFVDWGDGRQQLPDQPVNDTDLGVELGSSGNFQHSHIYADDGTYSVTVRIADDNMTGDFLNGTKDVDYVEQTFTVTVSNLRPTLTGIANVTVNEGQVFTLEGLGVRLEDPGFDNPFNPTMPPVGEQFTESFRGYTINWGDGTPADELSVVDRMSDQVDGPTTASFANLNQLLDRMDHVYADNGTYTVTLRLADDNMQAFADPSLFADEAGAGVNYVDLIFTIQVNNVAPTLTLPNSNLPAANQTIFESQMISLTNLGVITDLGFDNPNNPLNSPPGSTETFRYWVDWNDDGTFESVDTNAAMIDDVGSIEDFTDASFDGSHTFADNGTYIVRVRIADDDMTGDFLNGTKGLDYVEQTFTIIVTNAPPSFMPQPNGANFQGDDVSSEGITTIRVAYNDLGYDNLLNTFDSNGGETVETFNHVVQWGDGTVDAIHQYTTGGAFTVTVTMTPGGGGSQEFTFNNFNSANPVLTLVSSQQLNDPAVEPQVVTYVVNWGDGHVETFQLSGLLNPGLPVATNGLTTLVASARDSGDAIMLTTGSAEVQHRYLGPPDPLHPSADIVITLSVYDDDGAAVSDFIAVSNPGIQTASVAIDTTPDVPRLDLTQQPMTEVFIPDQGGLTQQLQIPDVRGGGGEVAATAERYLELREVFPDGTESQGYRIKDEALADLREFFATLPDGRYAIYLVRTENHSERLVIQVDVRRGRVIDFSDDSEGTRDRPPIGEEQAPAAAPLDENPLLENVPGADRHGDLETTRQGEVAEIGEHGDQRITLSPPLLVSLSAAALAAEPWSRRVDRALAEADETAWQRLRRAGRRGRRTPPTLIPSRMRPTANFDYNRT